MQFVETINKKKFTLIGIFLFLYVMLNLFDGERGLISYYEKQKRIEQLFQKKQVFIDQLDSTDRLVIMLFDIEQGRPVAIKILNSFKPPQNFSIGQANAMGSQLLKGKYSLRILTDKNNQPFRSTNGEIIGRSKELIPLGTSNLVFELDQVYTR